MKITSLKDDLVIATYEHAGESLTLKVDRNIITPGFLRRIAELTYASNGNGQQAHESEDGDSWTDAAEALERNARASGALLSADLIREWDLTEEDGVTLVPITEDTFARLPPLLVTSLFSFAMREAQTVKKTTSEIMPVGLSEKAEDAPSM